MKRSEASAIIKALKLHFSFDKDTGEYRVAHSLKAEKSAYYTSDLEDAVGTAKAMREWLDKKAALRGPKMVYAFKFRHGDYGFEETLIEVEAKELKDFAESELDAGGWTVRQCSADQAKRHVKDGGRHSTPLYIDGKRVVRAG